MQIIGGKHKKRRLDAPKSLIRPTSAQLREALFNICMLSIEDSIFLDLFAGSGAIGLEALSRGAKHVTFVEKNPASLASLKKNITLLKEEANCNIYPIDVFDAMKRLIKAEKTFDFIYADPPYGTKEASLSNQVLELSLPLLNKGGQLFLEDSQEASIDKQIEGLELMSVRKYGRACLRQFQKA